jgi:hypothetical protein
LSACWSGVRAQFWHFGAPLVCLVQAAALFYFLPETWLCCGWRLHSDLSNSGASGQFGTLRDMSGDAGDMQRASAFILGMVVRTCHSWHTILTSTLRNFLLKVYFKETVFKNILWCILNYLILVKIIKQFKQNYCN